MKGELKPNTLCVFGNNMKLSIIVTIIFPLLVYCVDVMDETIIYGMGLSVYTYMQGMDDQK